jgi:hypothetical protein
MYSNPPPPLDGQMQTAVSLLGIWLLWKRTRWCPGFLLATRYTYIQRSWSFSPTLDIKENKWLKEEMGNDLNEKCYM